MRYIFLASVSQFKVAITVFVIIHMASHSFFFVVYYNHTPFVLQCCMLTILRDISSHITGAVLAT